MKAVKVKKKEAEKIKRLLIDKALYNYDYQIKKDKDYLYFPIKTIPKLKLEIVDMVLKKKEARGLKDLLPKELTKYVPRGFDTIGNIAILEIPNEIIDYEKQIAEALLKLHKNIKTVVKKASIHTGVFRTRKYKYLAGKNTKETIYTENNTRLKLNIEEVYFSERLSHERMRIAKQIKPGENILVMFSGVGPYVFVIAKNTLAKKVTGIEINPTAHKYALENQKLNKTKNTELFLGDVNKVKLKEKYDRILMPLPKTGELFLRTAFKFIKENGIIHFYDFLNQRDFPKESIKKIETEAKKENMKVIILNSVKCGSYSPGNFRTCVDFKIYHQNN